MLNTLIAAFVGWLEKVISSTGVWGIMGLMTLESCNILIPSEATLPFAGYLVSLGKMNFHLAAFASATGCLIGSAISYYIGYFGGRGFVEKYGKYLFVSKEELESADKWVEKYGDWTFFVCRLLPIVRTFISLPAGILRAKKRFFFIASFLGSLIWSYIFITLGVELGEHLEDILPWWHKFDWLIVISGATLVAVYIYKHIKKFKNS